jgi:organic hydroperoxide reductase OsmC/OhrA
LKARNVLISDRTVKQIKGHSSANEAGASMKIPRAQGLVEDAERICFYSKVTSGNIAVTYTVV